MHRIVVCQVAVLFASVAAYAQAPSPNQAQGPNAPAHQRDLTQNSPANTTPPPPNAQPQAPDADQAAPAAVGPAQSNTTSRPTNPTPLGAIGHTMPSTMSESNAALDRLPIVALQFPLTEDQKQLIVKNVSNAPNVQTKANLANTHVAMTLPIDVPVQPFPDDVIQQVPGAGRYRYLKLDKRVLIIDPVFLSVLGDIKL